MKENIKIRTIFIEISGKCNAKCPYCAQSRFRQENRLGIVMSPILFEQILNHLFKIGIIENNNNFVTIALFNWGEPFLNPNMNEILQIIKNKKLKASISSNFIVKPNIDAKLLPVIYDVIFSLSGFSQDSYGKIHGASLKNVLNNFENFYKEIREHSEKTRITISWHRYLFNESEFWDAHKYFNRPGIFIQPVIAFLNDGVKLKSFFKEELSEFEIEKTKKDIFLDRIKKQIIYSKKKFENYYCPQLNHLVIDESGQLLSCCVFTRYDSDYVLGNILEMSSEEILNKKFNIPLCNECVSSGLAWYAHNSDISLPPGGGLNALKFKIYYYFHNEFYKNYNIFIKICNRLIKKLPFGEKFLSKLKNLKAHIKLL